jgi:hypothetical protein
MADRMFEILTRLMGQLHAGRVTMYVWLQSAMRGEHPIASKFGLQIGFGAIVRRPSGSRAHRRLCERVLEACDKL